MEKKLMKAIASILCVLPFVVTSCMMSDTEDIPDFGEQLLKDLNTIDAYLAANGIVADQDIDGFIRYVVHHDSTGTTKATIDSCATANYSGRFLSDGREFDKGTGFSFPLNGVIDGWKVGIPLLTVGDSATFYIPSGLAYGYYGFKPDIPANANLIFHVGLKKVGTTYKPSDRSCD